MAPPLRGSAGMRSAVVDDVKRIRPPRCVGIVLFDASRSRVFVMRGTTIEDAREYAVDERDAAFHQHRARGDAHRRAAHTARLVAQFHAQRPLDCLLVAGPPWARALLRQHLPTPLRTRLAGSLSLSVASGQSAILRAVLAKVEAPANSTSRAASHRVAEEGLANPW
jgi:Bacterial archaeo-eukaryotic release factor family 10